MSPLKIKHCIIAEDVRLERGGKSTILGFYGILPDVEMTIKYLDKPLERLAFLFTAESLSGTYKLQMEILRAAGQPIFQSGGDIVVPQGEGTKIANLVVGFGNVIFPESGTFTLRVTIDGNVEFEKTFVARQATAEEIARLGL